MIGAGDVRKDGSVFHPTEKLAGDAEVVDPPPDVVGACIGAVAPPGVGFSFVRVEMTEGIVIAAVQKLGECGTLLIRESGVLAVSLRSGEIDLVVRDIEVAAENHRLACGLQREDVEAECLIPGEAIR